MATEYRVTNGIHRISQDRKAGGSMTPGRNVGRGECFTTERNDLHIRWPEKYRLASDPGDSSAVLEENLALKAKIAELEGNSEEEPDKSANSEETLKTMTVSDLKKLAEDEGIELGDAVKKDDIIDTILVIGNV